MKKGKQKLDKSFEKELDRTIKWIEERKAEKLLA